MFPSMVFAGGPKSTFPEPRGLDAEFSNVYHDLNYPHIVSGTADTLTISSGTINSFMVVGTTQADSAPSGRIGEYVSSVITGATSFPTSTQFGDLTSISLTPGDWDVNIIGRWVRNGGTTTNFYFGISTASGNSFPSEQPGDNEAGMNGPTGLPAFDDITVAVPSYRISLNATTTIYFKYFATYTVATPKAQGRISARRIR